MKKALVILFILACIFSLIACSGKPIIVSIDYDGDGIETTAIEEIFQDENTVYYFPTIRSQSITVTYLNGDSEDIRSALNAGRATIADLDRFDIEYCTMHRK